MDSVNGGARKKIMEEVLREENLVLLPKDFVRVQHDKREAHGRPQKPNIRLPMKEPNEGTKMT
jgi:hypothetical protein